MDRKLSLLVLTLASFALNITASFAGEIPPFSATCTDKRVEAYRYSTDMNGKVVDNGWSKNEKFNSEWNFQYAGGNAIKVDNKLLPISAKSGPCLAVLWPTEAPLGIGVWIYAINVKLQTIVAAQVNASHGILDGIKTRSVSFECKFSFQ